MCDREMKPWVSRSNRESWKVWEVNIEISKLTKCIWIITAVAKFNTYFYSTYKQAPIDLLALTFDVTTPETPYKVV